MFKNLAEFRRRSGERKSRSFSPATCAAEKILLRLQVWNLCALGAQIMRAADCSPFVKKEYFLTAATPQSLAHGVSAQLVQKPRRVSPPQRRKKVRSFSSATCAAKKIPLGLQTCAPSALGGRRVRCSRPQTLLSKKYFFFDKDNPAGDCLRGCLSMTLQAQRSVFLHWDAGELRLRQITQTALPSSRQTAS